MTRASRWIGVLFFEALVLASLASLFFQDSPQPLVKSVAAQEPQPLEPDEQPFPLPSQLQGVDLTKQTSVDAASKSSGCILCHKTVHDPHESRAFHLGCTDCHGGDANTMDKNGAHVAARMADAWTSSGNPVRSYTLLNYERPEFIRFVNPGDLRVAHLSCGTSGCHPKETLEVRKSMMTHGCMLWGAALYNNGAVPNKWPRHGESYSMNGKPQRLQTVPPPTPEETAKKGVLPFLDPLPQFQITQPGNVLRIFERGGRFVSETGIPERLEEPGRPRTRLSNRGLGTQNRTDPVFIGLQKTRLLDPTLNFLGTNDHPGDYRSSGCTACHVVYANDRSPIHSGPYAKYGNQGLAAAELDSVGRIANPSESAGSSQKDGLTIRPTATTQPGFVTSIDPTIPKNEPGHPIQHKFTRAIPTSASSATFIPARTCSTAISATCGGMKRPTASSCIPPNKSVRPPRNLSAPKCRTQTARRLAAIGPIRNSSKRSAS
jgi:hypothetical protein